jgi:hypothetical protein
MCKNSSSTITVTKEANAEYGYCLRMHFNTSIVARNAGSMLKLKITKFGTAGEQDSITILLKYDETDRIATSVNNFWSGGYVSKIGESKNNGEWIRLPPSQTSYIGLQSVRARFIQPNIPIRQAPCDLQPRYKYSTS